MEAIRKERTGQEELSKDPAGCNRPHAVTSSVVRSVLARAPGTGVIAEVLLVPSWYAAGHF